MRAEISLIRAVVTGLYNVFLLFWADLLSSMLSVSGELMTNLGLNAHEML